MDRYNYLEELLANDLTYAEVYLALYISRNVDDNYELYRYLLGRTFSELMYHQHPSLPLSEEDKANKLIYPSRNNYFQKIIAHKRVLLKRFK